ncbi:WD40-repeat-containing domain protein [Geopyxis carbonaria]|nr:WD40-repeat-containing domain protein [Geopyxis carbonaria]
MAAIAVHTPVKSHSGLFNTRHAGGRMPLTPSPRARASANQSPFTTPPRMTRDIDWHAEKRRYPNAPRGSLHDTFAALSMSSTKRSTHTTQSPKTNIAGPIASPLRLDLGVSEWQLDGTGPTASRKSGKKSRTSRPAKTSIRINGDRFIPTRGASSPTTHTKIQTSSRPGTSGSNRSDSGSDVFGSRAQRIQHPNDYEDEDFIDGMNVKKQSPRSRAYESSIADACGLNLGTRILAFKPAAPESAKPIDLRSQYNRPIKSAVNAQTRRRILTAPERVLDAPGLVDDYYLNILDWGSSNQVAIGLERNVYVWNADSGEVNELCTTDPSTYVSSVKWSGDGAYVAVGLASGDVQIWDVEDGTKLRTMTGHETRVGVMSWNRATLTTGSRSGAIFNHDVRIAEHKTAELLSHTAEVCGLEWRSDGAQLASGGNDNMVNIWDARSMVTPKFSKGNHRAAVKALAWCPWQTNLLASGGGSVDGYMHFWNATTGARVNSIDTGSQVTGIKWSTNYREIVSCGGNPDNMMTVWSYPTLVKNVEIPAHESRILHSTLSPDGQTLATAASDESLKFWKIFEKKAGHCSSSSHSSTGSKKAGMKQMTIR